MESTRLGKADFLDAAMRLLDERGYAAVTAAGLCDALGVTRGSFYHHFGSLDGFIDALVAHWESEYTHRLTALVTQQQDAQTRAEMRTQAAVDLPHGAEAALRNWAVVHPAVAAAQNRVDQARQTALTALLRADGLPKQRAELLASMALSVLVGMQQRQRSVDPAALNEMFALLQQMVSREVSGGPGGEPADPTSLNRRTHA